VLAYANESSNFFKSTKKIFFGIEILLIFKIC
jgi:hypothetical protein